eukprot:scaffold87843_cov60-Phaeocystis_antarctica.AAC.6
MQLKHLKIPRGRHSAGGSRLASSLRILPPKAAWHATASCWQPASLSPSAQLRSHSCSSGSARSRSCSSAAGSACAMAHSATSTPRRATASGWWRSDHASSHSARAMPVAQG